ncbi:MAG: hypothetical protein ABIJ21_04695 [Nanoarchaeota archaeon]
MKKIILAAIVILTALIMANSAYATHTSTAELEPEWSPAGQSIDYSVSTCNTGGDNIDEFRIYDNILYTDFECDEIPGWTLTFIPTHPPSCLYIAENADDEIASGECETFTFSATSPEEGNCNLEWEFRTYDIVEYYQILTDTTSVDGMDPVIEKEVLGTQWMDGALCPNGPGQGEECWVTTETQINVYAYDASICQPPSLIDYCHFEIRLDGQLYQEFDLDGDDNGEIHYSLNFQEDSRHELIISCYDNAGNMIEDAEVFRVDNTNPETEKQFNGPQSTQGDIEWIDGITTISLLAEDPDPTGFQCNIGVDKTWYFNILAQGEDECWTPDEYCNWQDFQENYDLRAVYNVENMGCIDWAQEYCTANWEENWDSWYECVTDLVHNECNVPEYWQLYDENPIPKGEESCHIFGFMSIDELWNIEDVNTNCFFVDMTPPRIWKEVGDPKILCETDDCDYYVNQDTEITLSCEDQGSHPSNNVTIYWNIYLWENDAWTLLGEYNENAVEATFTFAQDSRHKVEYWCEDAVGKRSGPETFETDVMYLEEFEVIEGRGDVNWSDPFTIMIDDEAQIGGDIYTINLCDEGDTCIEFSACIDGSDTVGIFNGTLYLNHFNNNPIGSPVDCPEDYWELVKIDGISYPLYYYNDKYWFGMPFTEIDIVDTQGPEFMKTVGDPSVLVDPECDPLTGECSYYITQETLINITCEDMEPHPVGGVTIYMMAFWDEDNDGENWELIHSIEQPGMNYTFNMHEDSSHKIVYWCKDALNNVLESKEEIDYVDTTPPLTNKTYGEPSKVDPICELWCQTAYCEEGDLACIHACTHSECTWWITSQTPITLAGEDPQPHPVGSNETYWRNLYFPDNSEICNRSFDAENYCHPEYYGQFYEGYPEIEWNRYTEPFYKPEESCHVIEYYSVDLLGNMGDMQWQCVYVDNTPPEGMKTVGDPKLSCDPINGGGGDVNGTEDCIPEKTWTTNLDFDLGILNGVEHDSVPDELHLILGESFTLPLLWVANAGDPSVSKFDTDTGKELARYKTWFGVLGSFGSHSGPAPSRTAVDTDGNVFVANRHFDSNKPAEVVKILVDDWIDRNDNGVLDTSFDADFDGEIQIDEMYPLDDLNMNNIVDDDEILDERIAWIKQVGGSNGLGRSLAIDLDGNIWVGLFNDKQYWKISGDDGSILLGPIDVSPNTPYGALVDKHGILWGSSLSYNLLKLNTETLEVEVFSTPGLVYGIALAYDENDNTIVILGSRYGDTYYRFDSVAETFTSPAQEPQYSVFGVATDSEYNILAGNLGTGDMHKFDPNGNRLWQSNQLYSEIRGTVVDNKDNVWAVYLSQDKIGKFNGTDGTPLGLFNTGHAPYTYSDATGLGLRGSVSVGTWTVIYDSEGSNTQFNHVSWNAFAPEGGDVSVRVRSSSNQVAWSSWEDAENGVVLSTTPDNRYLQIEVKFEKVGADEGTPILYDLTVDATCGGGGEPQYYDCWWVRDHVTPITLDCVDQGEHPVQQEIACYRISFDQPGQEWLTEEYCNYYGGTLEEDWCCVYVGEEQAYEFFFTEDSVHDLEFYCRDHLGNTEEEPDIEYFKVDSIPPTTIKTYLGPYHEEEGVEWIDTISTIQLTATDGGEICAVGNMTTFYWYGLVPDEACLNVEDCHPVDHGDWMLYEEPFGIPEESCHIIEYYSVDALYNTEEIKYQCVFADHTPPVITKDYGEPYYADETAEWISSQTPIYMSAYDSEPHPSGVDTLEYRVSLVEDDSCWNREACLGTEGLGDWMDIGDGMFNIIEESCHLIEAHAVDNVGKESWHEQCVFVDNSAPVPNKTVGEPSTMLTNYTWLFYPEVNGHCWTRDEDSIDCWGITLLTPVSLQCSDPEPHPVDHEATCFKYGLDGDDITESRCDDYQGTMGEDGFCCAPAELESFYFNEISEHNLAYYCVDALGNKGPIDDEKFKVEETSFEIELNKKWNLISTPVKLIDNSIEEVFADVADNMMSVWTYDAFADQWYLYTPNGDPTDDDLTTLDPGTGYWVLMADDDLLVIGGSLMQPGQLPPSKPLKGDTWNLIGYWGAEGLTGYYGPQHQGDHAWCHMLSLGDSIWDLTFTSLWSYWEPYNPNMWIPYDQMDRMDPGAGYWVFPIDDGTYVPNTVC